MHQPLTIVLATQNPGKVAEIRALLSDLDVQLLTADDLDAVPNVVEDAPTLQGNARKKAMAFHRQTGYPALADDTGLEVEALEGAPGVHTARYAGPNATPTDNNVQLLQELIDKESRRARFRTVVAFVDADGEVHTFEGICEGRIASAPRGQGGFGYDPVFTPEGETRTFAEMSPDEKNAISHRKKALHRFVAYLQEQVEAEEDE